MGVPKFAKEKAARAEADVWGAKEAHLDTLSDSLDPEVLKYFLKLYPVDMYFILETEHFASLEHEPTPEDANVVDAYVEWWNMPASLEEIAESYNVGLQALMQLIGNVPGFLQDRFKDRRTEIIMGTRVVGNTIGYNFRDNSADPERDELAPVRTLAGYRRSNQNHRESV
jgi:hypothetical protein